MPSRAAQLELIKQRAAAPPVDAQGHPRGVRSVALPGDGQATAAERVNNLFTSYAPLGLNLPWYVLEHVELLSRWNPDYGQAISNIKTLANSGFEILIEGSSARAEARLRERINEKARVIQERHGGLDGLVTKLLDQAATYGAMCGEWVLSEDLDDVIDFIDVNPKSIRFFWEDEHWHPYQKVTASQAKAAKARGQKVRNGNCIQLNESTFHYYAFEALPGNPYGVPPFLAALENIAIQKDMINNMAQIVKKVGMLGVIDLVVKNIPMERGETPEAYQARAGAYLSQYASAIEEMMRSGGIAHFDDAELNHYVAQSNVAGVTQILKSNEEFIFSGLRSMPSVQGRSYSTTETYAGVAYDIIIRNTFHYQRACKRMIEAGLWLMATMWGEQPNSLSMTFKSNKTLHRLQDAQAHLLEIKAGLMMWVSGLIDQQGFAQHVGVNEIHEEMDEPPESQILGNSSPGGGAGTNSTDDQIQPPARSDSGVELSPAARQWLQAQLDDIQANISAYSGSPVPSNS